jgi:hypothetical protein
MNTDKMDGKCTTHLEGINGHKLQVGISSGHGPVCSHVVDERIKIRPITGECS